MSSSPFKSHSKGNKTSGLSTILGITLVLTMLGLLGILLFINQSVSSHFKKQLTINLMMETDVSESEVLKLKKELETNLYTHQAIYISKDEAAQIEIQELGEDFVSFLGENPLPASLELSLEPNYTHVDSVEWIINSLSSMDNIHEVVYHPGLIKTMNDNLARISFGLIIFSALLLIIAIALINNTIRLAVFSKRFIIKSMQLVGATSGFIRRPFILKGIWYGIFSAVLASGIITGLLYLLKNEIPEIPKLLFENNYFLPLIACLFILGIIISWISTQLAVRKFIRMKQDKLY